MGVPDYLVTMRKPGDNAEPIAHTIESSRPALAALRLAGLVRHPRERHAAVPERARGPGRAHICPLQLDVIRRGVTLWSNPGDVVFSPFAGIGSEGVIAIEKGRKFLGIELKDLASLGFDAEWTVRSAADVGAPHLRERVWVVAYSNKFAGKIRRFDRADARQGGLGGVVSGGSGTDDRRQPYPPRMSEWPTPTVQDAAGSRNATARRPNGNGKHHSGVTLTDALILEGDMEMPPTGQWPTPTSRDGKDMDAPGRQGGGSLCEAVRTFPDASGRRSRRRKQQPQGGEEAGNVADGTRVKNYPTPRANDGEKRGKISDDPRNGLPGVIENEEEN
jgi:site-specific DNA-cytosine methylase